MLPKAKPSRGFTLLEVLIASSLLLLMLAGSYQALVLARAYHLKLGDTSQLQQDTMTALSKIERSIESASALSLEVYDTDTSGIRFVSAKSDNGFFDVDPSGRPMWTRWVGIYQELRNLVYREQGFTPSSTVPTFPTLADIRLNTTARRELWSKQLESLYFIDGASTITVELETRSSAPKPNGLRVRAFVHVAL